MVAVSFALAVTHPSAGNIGGGGFLVYYEKATDSVWTLDYREVAPAASTRSMYLDEEGKPKPQASTVPTTPVSERNWRTALCGSVTVSESCRSS